VKVDVPEEFVERDEASHMRSSSYFYTIQALLFGELPPTLMFATSERAVVGQRVARDLLSKRRDGAGQKGIRVQGR
jgi:hypothetical protein